MQDIANLWQQVTQWIATLLETVRSTNSRELFAQAMSSLWDISVWLNTGYKGLTVALILLVIIVNRILRRQH